MICLLKKILATSALLSLLFVSTAALAQGGNGNGPSSEAKGDWDVSVGAGVAFVPTFEGSDRYRVAPLPFVKIVYKDMISLDAINGLNAYWQTGGLRLGAGVVYNSGRSDHKDSGMFGGGDDRLKGMGDIDGAVGFKGFASYRLEKLVDMSVAVTKFVGDDNDGVVVDLGLKTPIKLTDKLMLFPHMGATWANEDYMETFFGVTAAQASRTGFSRFDADAGFKDIRAGIDVNYKIDEHWLFSVRTDVKRFVGDASKSPISFTNTNVTVATMIGYKF